MIYLIIFAPFYLFVSFGLWCVIRSGSEHRKPTPQPDDVKRFEILELEKLWRTR